MSRVTAPAAGAAPPPLDAGELQALPWAHETPALRALGLGFGVRTTDAAVGRYLSRIFAPFRVPGTPPRWYSWVETDGASHYRHALYLEDRRLLLAHRPERVFHHLLWHVNRQVVEASGDYVLLHAAGAVRRGRAVLMPAPAESGKTTLVAGLVRAGMQYLTDEMVAIDPGTGLAQPFPKALSVDPGSWPVLMGLEPRVEPAVARYVQRQWQVEPTAIRKDSIAGPAEPVLIVSPHYESGARAELHPVSKAQALVLLADSAFALGRHGRRNFAALSRLADRAPCYRLRFDDLAAASEAVLRHLTA